MKKRILKGNSDFEYLVGNNGYFVDKTLLIKDFYNNNDHVLVIPRPRRFGKTLNLSMIEYFFDVRKKENAKLFEEFKITKDKAFCKTYQNQFPVINISLKHAIGSNWEMCLSYIKTLISGLYREHKYLLFSKKLEEFEKEEIRTIIYQKGNESDYAFSLKKLSSYLQSHFGKKSIIMIDEYDSPIINGFNENYYSDVIKFMKTFFGSAFKGNPFLEKGLITGIMRIAKESLFSELNNLGVYTVLAPYFSDKFGFTQEETQEILAYFDLKNDFEGVKTWYNGYKFGNQDFIYNPWSIMNFISRRKEGFKTWWVNTGTDSLIKKRIAEPDVDDTYDTLQKIVSGEVIACNIEDNFVFQDFDLDKELLWTLLLFSGYLTAEKQVNRTTYLLRVPNYEVKTVFQDIITKWFRVEIKLQRSLLNNTAQHLVNNRLKKFEKGFKKIIGDTFSYFDVSGEAEKVYQAYVLGLLAIIGDDYIIRSNRESGEGRYDILLIPHDKSKFGVVIEIKQLPKKKKEEASALKKRVNEMLVLAAAQIEENQYYKELLEHQIKQIIKLPIVFVGKTPYLFSIES